MIIMRLETADQQGLYKSKSAAFMLDFSRHIIPQHDSLLWESLMDEVDSDDPDELNMALGEYRFGFINHQQIQRWIYRKEWFQMLHEMGIVLSEYTCYDYDVIVGHSQAIFKTPVSRIQHNLLDYFNI
jgi:hypothetical protein